MLKGTVRSYDSGAGTAEVEVVGSHGNYITVPVGTHLDARSVYAGLRCAILSFNQNDQGDAVLVATYDELPLMGAKSLELVDWGATDATDGQVLTADGDGDAAFEDLPALDALGSGSATDGHVLTADGAGGAAFEALPALGNHDHSGDAGDGGSFDAGNLGSGSATDGQVLTADGAGGAAFEAVPAQPAVLDYDAVEAGTGPTTSSTSVEDMSGISVSVTVSQNALILLRMALTTWHDTAGRGGYVLITDSSNNAKSTMLIHYGADAGERQTGVCIGLAAVGSGTHTFKGRFYCITGGVLSTDQVRFEAIALSR